MNGKLYILKIKEHGSMISVFLRLFGNNSTRERTENATMAVREGSLTENIRKREATYLYFAKQILHYFLDLSINYHTEIRLNLLGGICDDVG